VYRVGYGCAVTVTGETLVDAVVLMACRLVVSQYQSTSSNNLLNPEPVHHQRRTVLRPLVAAAARAKAHALIFCLRLYQLASAVMRDQTNDSIVYASSA